MEDNSTLLVVQWITDLPSSLDIVITPDCSDATAETIPTEVIDQALAAAGMEFESRFDHQFPDIPADYRSLGRYLVSNLVGGYSYAYGDSYESIPSSNPLCEDDVVKLVAPTSLFSTTPCRTTFPRGFLWDEGFHQQVVSRWNVTQSMYIYDSWLSHIDESGWVGREQILGEESRSRVPWEYVPQSRSVANPPMLIITLGRIIQRLKDQPEQFTEQEHHMVQALVHKYLPSLHAHVEWYYRMESSHTNVAGAVTSMAWRGRNIEANKCLPSGLDDYPRAEWQPNATYRLKINDPTDLRGVEGHVDLHSWMIALCNTMINIVKYAAQTPAHITVQQHQHQQLQLPFPALIQQYRSYRSALQSSLLNLHWLEDHSTFADYAYDSDGMLHHQVHIGYVSLVPTLLGCVKANSLQLVAAVEQMRESRHLWTPYGLRSLSPDDPYYRTDDNYWRSPIWININYMALVALQHYAQLTSPHLSSPLRRLQTPLAHMVSPELARADPNATLHQAITSLYDDLRHDLLANLQLEWQRTGYIWEHYNDDDGLGDGAHPFTGWSTLTLLIMAETY